MVVNETIAEGIIPMNELENNEPINNKEG